MELKTKYQYTYFIKPFLIREDKYDKYLLKLLKNKDCSLRTFEKERDLDIYTHFLPNVREYFFPTFSYNKEKIKKLHEMDQELKSVILSKLHCNVFEYKMDTEIQGRVGAEDSIFFNISKMEIICLDTGICFLIIKTNLENSDAFSEVLDFNFKFKDINSEFYKLRAFNNIKIQTDKFSNMKELSTFINEIIGANDKYWDNKDIDLYNKRFFTYTYTCIDQEHWNVADKFENIEDDFFKYTNVLPNNYNSSLGKEDIDENYEVSQKLEFARFGFTKQSSSLLVSNIDIENYTTLPFEYENQYLYTLIITLYQRIYLKKVNIECKSKKDINDLRKRFTKFVKEIWIKELTNAEIGTMFYANWKRVFELEEIYEEIKNKYDVIYKEIGFDSSRKLNKAICFALIISLLVNILNFIVLMNLK